ncbi:MAG: dihydrolipoyl dehydrogenase [Planctomycetes bacterium]|nr:dihydrolipoyl dehydrogenase [Planctomycetota bacterium]
MTNVTVIGSGPGGYVAAIKAAQLGANVTVIEKDSVGGTCLNRGCIPTKAILASADTLLKAKEAAAMGIIITGEIKADVPKIIERKDKIVSNLIKGIEFLFKKNKIKLVNGMGSIKSPTEVSVKSASGEEKTVKADMIILATGSEAARIPIFPFDGRNVITSTEALKMTEIPQNILIVGAGAIGVEFASYYNALGSTVTIVEMLPQPVPTEDPDIAAELIREYKKRGIKILTGVKIEKVEIASERSINATLSTGETLNSNLVLVSIGRALNSSGIGLETAGVKTERGKILIDKHMRTSIPNIFAIGDVAGGMLLAHKASFEGIAAAENCMGAESAINYDVIPRCMFSEPEIASVGLTEPQCKDKGFEVNTGKFSFRALGKAQAMGKLGGLVKIIADKKTDKILGVHIIGSHTADIVHEGAVAMQAGVTAKQLAQTIHVHPTLSEAVMEAAHGVHGETIHG